VFEALICITEMIVELQNHQIFTREELRMSLIDSLMEITEIIVVGVIGYMLSSLMCDVTPLVHY